MAGVIRTSGWKALQILLLLVFGISASAQNVDSLLCTPFANSGLAISNANAFNFTTAFSTSGSTWEVDSFPESTVFHAQLEYSNELDTSESYTIRVGKGGNIYSFRGAFGESVPPQWRNPNWVQPTYGGGTSYAPWVDEVWQMVAVDGALNNTPDSSYFIHQAGVYLKTPEQTEPFYSPLLAEYYNEGSRSYSVVNWGQQAHTEDLQNINFRSDLLYYTRYTVVGDGILQVDNMMYNFGNDNISFINVPWGGVRNSSLDHFFISEPSHNYNLADGLYGQTPVIQTASTGGWVAWSNDTLGASPTLAMAHPTNTSTSGNVFRYGDAGNLTNPNNLRDYHVFEMIRFPSAEQLSFGTALSFRFYYVLGENVDSVKNTIVDHGLVSASFDSDFIPQKFDIDSVEYNVHSSANTFSVTPNSLGLMLRVTPYQNSYPLFLISSGGEEAITSNPYHYSSVAYDGITDEIDLLGFIDNKSRVAAQYDTLCNGDSYTFPDGTIQESIMSDLTHVSTINSVLAEWDSVVFTHLFVNQLNTDVVQSGNSLESQLLDADYQWLNCDDNFAIVQGEVSQTLNPSISGNFAVEVSDNSCVDTSSCVAINLVGVLTSANGHGFSYYPNPTTDKLTIDFETRVSEVFVTVIDPAGRVVLSQKFTDTKRIDLETPKAAGLYSVQLTLDELKTTQFKFVKE